MNPTCVGIIMDGNRRWAKAHRKPLLEGHTEGYKKLKEVVRWAQEREIPHIVAYTFSTENWGRSTEEVNYLMQLFRSVLETETKQLCDEHIRVRFVGDRSRFSEEVQSLMRKMEKETEKEHVITLHLLMSYGGRAEIIAAVNELKNESGSITEESFAKKLWSHEIPDPDLIIRTGGEKRLSNFLPWQSVYSELFFIDTYWPDFSEKEFDFILGEFKARDRRRGK